MSNGSTGVHSIPDVLSPVKQKMKHANNNKNILLVRRIIDIFYFIKQIHQLDNHSKFGCSFSDIKIISEKRKELNLWNNIWIQNMLH